MKPTSKPKPVARKKSTPAPMPVKPKAKPKTLNDFLKEGKRPPSKNKKGILSSPDVIIKGYNDKKSKGMK
jgi:tripartite-type tricarboxylate transporter receptor subunit TctC